MESVSEIFEIAARHGLIITRLAMGDLRLSLMPKELAALQDAKAPAALPDNFDELPTPGLPPNWQDPGEQQNTEEIRKRASNAQEAADRLVFGAGMPDE